MIATVYVTKSISKLPIGTVIIRYFPNEFGINYVEYLLIKSNT